MQLYLFEDLLKARDESGLAAAIRRVSDTLGFETYCYALAYHPLRNGDGPSYFIFENYPKTWLNRYLEQDYAATDPSVTHCYGNTTPLVWSHRLFEDDGQRRIHREACEFGINGGATLPINSNWLNGTGCLTLGTPDDADKVAPHVVERLGEAQLLACYVNQAVRNLSLLPEELSFRQHEELTPREIECLRWATQGLPAKLIASRMGISTATVTAHFLPAIRRKLGVSTTREAVSVAVYHRLIQF